MGLCPPPSFPLHPGLWSLAVVIPSGLASEALWEGLCAQLLLLSSSGTLMAYLEIYEEPVSTPESMKRTLEQPDGRRKFLAGPVLADGRPDPSATGCEGRRLDYIMYREHPGSLDLRTAVEKVSFITHLATCSDHLPFGLRLHVAPAAHMDEA
nr:PREDICTED: sphingomyelin phosphodiesterase 3-like [Anolis carolinensis]|eukprot:XP_016853994.1 PREDICTED: sphingomyelin phosphodiesterase 3-like [Anolis carolinensis]